MDTKNTTIEIFGEADRVTRAATGEIKGFLKNSLWIVYALLCVLFPIICTAVETGFQNPFEADKLINTAYISICSLAMYTAMIGPGKKSELGNGEAYRTAKTKLAERSDRIRALGKTADFSRYCTEMAMKQCEAVKRHYVYAAAIDWEEFKATYAHLSPRELNKSKRKKGSNEGLTAFQLRALKKAIRYNRVRTIYPELILLGGEKVTFAELGTRHASFRTRAIARKIFSMLLVSVALSSVYVRPSDAIVGLPIVVMMISRAFSVLFAAFSGFRIGVDEVRYELAVFDQSALFIDGFFEDRIEMLAQEPLPSAKESTP